MSDPKHLYFVIAGIRIRADDWPALKSGDRFACAQCGAVVGMGRTSSDGSIPITYWTCEHAPPSGGRVERQ